MKWELVCTLLVLCAGSLPAQPAAPASAPTIPQPKPQVRSIVLGFSYLLPAGWEVVDTKPSLPKVQKQVEKDATTDAEMRGINCVQVALTARHGSPASVVVVVALPFDCFGEQMTDKELPGFAQGALNGIDGSFAVSGTVSARYSLGAHSLWIERSKGNVKGHAEAEYTIETVCSVLKKGAVCWMVMAADQDALAAFEGGAVTLDGDAHPALVPAAVFENKPSRGQR
ncbi:MAG: hypothetical protein WBE76_30665 [Terracidiphilus sp.]